MSRTVATASLFAALCGASAPATAGLPPSSPLARGAGFTLPDDFPAVNVTTLDNPDDGLLFLAKEGGTDRYLLILDDTGFPAYFRAFEGVVRDFKKQPDGRLTYFDRTTVSGSYVAMDSTYTVVDEWLPQGYPELDSHDIQILPNGNALVLYYDEQVVDMSVIVPGGDPEATVIGLVIQEIDTSDNVVFEWASWDHFEITDCTTLDLTAPTIDYVHANAIELDDDGNLLLSSRHLDEITKIDRQTGDIIWRMGGSQNEFTLVGDTQWFTRQHDVRRTASGTITIFDNGNLSTPQESRVVEYSVDETNKIATLVWDYRHSPALYAAFTGSAQRLPNGNTLVSWGPLGIVTEVRPDSTTAFEMNFVDTSARTYRAFRFPWTAVAAAPTVWAHVETDSVTLNFVKFGDEGVAQYNIYRDPVSPPTTLVGSTSTNSFVLTDVSPGETFYVGVTAEDGAMVESPFSNELQIVVPTAVAVALVDESLGGLTLDQNFPNPFAGGTNIRFALPVAGVASLSVYDVSGRLVKTLVSDERMDGPREVLWDGRDSRGRRASAGVYFYRLATGQESVTKRMTLLR